MPAPGSPFRLGPDSRVVADVRAALAAGPGRPKEIWRRTSGWAHGTVRLALQDLVTLGDVVHEGPPGYRVYRLAAAPAQAA